MSKRDRSPRTAVAGTALVMCLITALGAGCAGSRLAAGVPPGAAGAEVAVSAEPLADGPPGGPSGELPANGSAAGPVAADAGTGSGGIEPAPHLPAGVPPPDTAAGRAFGDWLELYNRGSEPEIQGFVGSRFAPEFLADLPVEALVAFHLQSRETTGELIPVEIKPAGENGVMALAGAVAGGSMTVGLTVEPEAPHRITGLRLMPPGS